MRFVNNRGFAFSDTFWVFVLAGGLLFLLAARLVALSFNATDLFFDEAQYWYWSLEPAFGYYSKPPMIAWLIRLATESCGLGEFCVRLPSPLIHTASAVFVFLIGWRLYELRTGAIAALVFATLPGVSLSSGIISTDVPLLMFWGIALFAFIGLFEDKSWWPALLLGVALGLGLNAKYAMAWFVLCGGIYLAMTPERRFILKDVRLYVALGIGAVMIVPNILWNIEHKFATLSHTADNAKWGGDLIHPIKALEFLGAQFGVFGPILFGALLVIGWRALRMRLPEADRLLLAFCLPLIAIITLQAFASRAHANWAAVAYVSASVLVTATMIRDVAWRWLGASMFVHVCVLSIVIVGTSLAGRWSPSFGNDPFARTLGWRELAQATRDELEQARAAGLPFASVLTDDRPVTAELLYYMRDDPTPMFAWQASARPLDHFELMRPFTGSAREPVLLVTLFGSSSPVPQAFSNVKRLGDRMISAGLTKSRRVTFYALSGYQGTRYRGTGFKGR